jgi:hypothetical protein
VVLSRAPAEQEADDDTPFEDAPPAPVDAAQLQPAREVYRSNASGGTHLFGLEENPDTHLLPGEHRVVAAPSAATAGDDGRIPPIEVARDLMPFDAYLRTADFAPEVDASYCNLHGSGDSANEDDPICFGVAGDSDSDEEGNGELVDCPEQDGNRESAPEEGATEDGAPSWSLKA